MEVELVRTIDDDHAIFSLMRGEAEMSTLWIFFAILGGMQLFGLPGLVYGPLIFGLCAVLLSLYESEFKDFLTEQANT